MIKKSLITFLLFSITTSAFAGSGGESNNTGCNGAGNANSPCAPSTGSTTTPNYTNTNGNSNNNLLVNNNSNYAGSAASASSNSISDSLSMAGASVNSSGNSSSVASGGLASSDVKNTSNVANNVNGGGTSINSVVNVPRQAPPSYAPNLSAQGNNSYSGGLSTPFGGISFGGSSVDGSVRQLNRATADGILVDAMIKVQQCDSVECVAFKKYLLKRFK